MTSSGCGFCYAKCSQPLRVLGVAVPRPLPASKRCFALFAAGLGLEPRYTVPETAVLPLDDPAITNCLVTAGYWKNPVFSTCTKTIYTEPKC